MGIDMNSLTGNYATRNDYTSLFQSLPSRSGNSGAANLNFLSDYASIKNGSYGKLMKAYYGGNNNVNSIVNNSSTSTSKDNTTQLKSIETAAESLKSSADKLLETGSKSLFNGKEVTTTDEAGVATTKTEYDTDALFKAVSSFVNDYNNVIDKAGDSNTSSIINRVNSLSNMTKSNKNLLERVGITIGENGKLSIDEEVFKKADMTTAKTLFNGTGSYGFQVSAQASLIDFAAANEAAKANTYSASGSFNNSNSSGNLFNTYF